MTTVLQRYIATTILTSTALVLFILLGIYTFMDFITELDDLGKGQYQIGDIASFIALSMPKRIYELLPIAALLGSVLGLGNLASQSELVAMRAAGMSVQQINKAVMIVAVCLMFVAVIVGEVIRPPAEQKARQMQSVAQTGTIGSRSDHGFWTRDGLHFNHIRQILPDGRFSDISIYEFDPDNRLRIITKAEVAEYDEDSWTLSNVVQSTIDEQGVRIRSVEHARWKSQLNPGMVNVVVVPPEFLPVWGLLEYVAFLKQNHQAVERYQLAFWMKVMMPISSAVMVFLAVPFIFGPLRSTPIGGRILAGALIGIGFHLFNQSFQHIGLVFGVLPWLTAAFPPLVFAGIGYYLMQRVR
ncbi:LPS export ABC transporter permease LptG [Methylophaga sp. 41_12_T18]|nr:LPS export ABC transporter permease LptG [Methylophaga sp. 41_12_T18]